MKRWLRQMIDDGALRYEDVVLTYYRTLKLTETEALALIKLHALLQEKKAVIKPEKFAKTLSLSTAETQKLLEQLIEKGYLRMTLITHDNGKEQESFDVDHVLMKVGDVLMQSRNASELNTQHAWIAFLEDTLQRPLSPLDVDMVTQWIDDDKYGFNMVKEATFEALKHNNPSVRLIDSLLLKKVSQVKKATRPKKKDLLKDFHSLWDE